MERASGTPMPAEYVCIRFRRAPESLIEEPEVCENCVRWRDGFCVDGGEKDER